VDAARALLVRGAALHEDPLAPVNAAGVLGLIRRLGYVQLDSINSVERAHHHILWTRRHAYRPAHLASLQASGKVFEHWTHDASIIPAEHFPHWKHRIANVGAWQWSQWLQRKLGTDRERVLAHVLERIRAEGPLMARDFAHPEHKGGTWWDWNPSKAALEYWWRAGQLSVPRREGFQKVYDLTSRTLGHVVDLPAPDRAAHIDWCCWEALTRLGVATARELAAFHASVSGAEAAAWAAAAADAGRVVRARMEVPGGKPRPCVALPNWSRAASAAARALDGMRLLSPFDPIVRDRARCLRVFGFDYRFEAFTPAPKRKFGYYVLPILSTRDGASRLVGRLDPELNREAGLLKIRKVWWEIDLQPHRDRRKRLEEAVAAYARFNGVERWELPKSDDEVAAAVPDRTGILPRREMPPRSSRYTGSGRKAARRDSQP
jgi:uncharacterized protein YcaQ